MAEFLLEAISLSHSFDYPLYRNVSLSMKAGSSVAVVGRSGSGKSTLLHTMSTFVIPDSGSVKLMGKDIYTMSKEEIEIFRRDEIGIIFQAHYLFKGMTGRENVEISSILADKEINDSILEALEISDVIDQKIGDLSGGQQQRVSIARVLNKRPKIIFADEPTGNLDSQTAMLVMDVLTKYVIENQAILFLVTHDDVVASRCDVTYNLENLSLSKLQ